MVCRLHNPDHGDVIEKTRGGPIHLLPPRVSKMVRNKGGFLKGGSLRECSDSCYGVGRADSASYAAKHSQRERNLLDAGSRETSYTHGKGGFRSQIPDFGPFALGI